MDGIGRRYSVWNVITTTKVVMSHALSEMDDKIDGGYLAIRTTEVHPSPKVMADFFTQKNQHDALIQFAQFLVDLWSVC